MPHSHCGGASSILAGSTNLYTMAQNKKIIFIPGWMYSPDYFKLGKGINVWEDDIELSRVIACDYLIGHSLGAAVALRMWEKNRKVKLILVNPFLGGKSFGKIFFDWLRYAFEEGVYDSKKRLGIKYLFKNFRKLFMLMKSGYQNILKDVPKENIKILHGEKDLFLCGKSTQCKLKEVGLQVIEVLGAGHNWHENFDKEIKKIIGFSPIEK